MKKIAIFVVLMLVASAFADDNTFMGTGNWSDAGMWSLGVVPGDADRADIASNGNLTLDSGDWLVSGLRVAGYKFDWSGKNTPVTFNMSGGSLTCLGDGAFFAYGSKTVANVNISGGALNAGAGWGHVGDDGQVYWQQTGGSVTLNNNYGAPADDPGVLEHVYFNITGGSMYLMAHPVVRAGPANMIMEVGGTAFVKLDDAGVYDGGGTASYVLKPGGTFEIFTENLGHFTPYFTATQGYEQSVDGRYTKFVGTPEPITLAILGLGGLFIRRRG
jgi:hypothetical protein